MSDKTETKGEIIFPHNNCKEIKLKEHVNHVLEDNAKLHAELHSAVEKENPKLSEMFSFYEDLCVWVMIRKYMNIPVTPKDEVQDYLDKAWDFIDKHPDTRKTRCSDCLAHREIKCTEKDEVGIIAIKKIKEEKHL